MISDTWKLQPFQSQHSGVTITSHNFSAVMDFWPIGIFERYCANLFACKRISIIYYTVTPLDQSFGGLFSLVEPLFTVFYYET